MSEEKDKTLSQKLEELSLEKTEDTPAATLTRQDSQNEAAAAFPNQPPNPSLKFGGEQLSSDAVASELKLLPDIVADIMNPDRKDRHLEQTTKIRKLLSVEHNPPMDQVISTGVIPFLIAFLAREGEPLLQFEACWALTNIASGSATQASVVVGATPLLANLIKHNNNDLAEQAVWCIGNLAGDSPRMRDLVLAHNCLGPLLELLSSGSTKLSTLRNGVWTLSNFCRGKPAPDFKTVGAALPVLARLIYSRDDEVLTDATWALSYLSDGDNTKIQAVIESGVCRRLVELLAHRSANIVTPVLRTVGNIVTGDDVQTQVVLNCGVLPVIRSLLSNPKKGIRKEALWTISNITAGNRNQIEAVIEANLVPAIIPLMQTGDYDIRKEAAWAISNLASGGSPDHIRYIVNSGVLPNFVSNLNSTERHLLMVSLEALENILRAYRLPRFKPPRESSSSSGSEDTSQNEFKVIIETLNSLGILPALRSLLSHESNEIADKATALLENHFDNNVDGEGDSEGESGRTLSKDIPKKAPIPPSEWSGGFNIDPPQGSLGGFSFGPTTSSTNFGFSFGTTPLSTEPVQTSSAAGRGGFRGRGARGRGRGGRGLAQAAAAAGRGGRGRGFTSTVPQPTPLLPQAQTMIVPPQAAANAGDVSSDSDDEPATANA